MAQNRKLKIMAKRNDSSNPLILRFTTWLRDNPYGMQACQPDAFIKLGDKSEHPIRKNILTIHSKYFKVLFGLDPDQKHYELHNVKKEVFEAFLDFCYKKTLPNLSDENFNNLWKYADYVVCQQLIENLFKLQAKGVFL